MLFSFLCKNIANLNNFFRCYLFWTILSKIGRNLINLGSNNTSFLGFFLSFLYNGLLIGPDYYFVTNKNIIIKMLWFIVKNFFVANQNIKQKNSVYL